MAKNTNKLIHSSSPYLLQHAHNPVNWVEWSEEAFQQAQEEDKLVLISVGYSACHWCHVMAHECFENEEVAELMNKHLICIKVDREERPDVDQIYMNAVQLMTQQGGWPLNCFTLPDGRPIFGGTYFPKEKWKDIIHQLQHTLKTAPDKVEEYAKQVTEGVIYSELVEAVEIHDDFDSDVLKAMVHSWKQSFDFEEGGNTRVPKFPLPNNYEFLLRYGVQFKDTTTINHVHKTLHKIGFGGIYDQIAGGFARYSTDRLWKVPHFEKMLYDNAQLLSIYAKAFQQTNSPLYKDIIEGTINWLIQDMRSDENGFYSALDADSEGVEGKFYIWTKEELQEILEKDYDWFSEFYNVNQLGLWESNQYILMRTDTKKEWCERHQISLEKFEQDLTLAQQKLLKVRSQRISPGLDDKQLTSWNAMTIKGLAEAGLALQNDEYIKMATQTAQWLIKYQYNSETQILFRTRKDGKSKINGFLEDYAHTIDAFITLFEITFDKQWIDTAVQLMKFTIEHFYDTQSKMFFFTDKDTELFTRKMEINDNVIPASNSVMANNLFKLSKLLHSSPFAEMAKQMLSNIYNEMPKYGSGYSNWGLLALSEIAPFYEVVISGEDAQAVRQEFGKHYIPQAVFMGGNTMNTPFLENKAYTKKSTLYICERFVCQAPTQSIDKAVALLKSEKD